MEFDLRGDVGLIRGLTNNQGFIDREIDLEVVNKPQLPFVAKVECFSHNSPAPEIGRVDPENPGEVCWQIGFGCLNGQTQIGNADGHGMNAELGKESQARLDRLSVFLYSVPRSAFRIPRLNQLIFELMLTNVWMCGRARKLHTKPGPSNRQ